MALTAIQKPVLEAIISFLKSQLDKYSLVKATETKLLNLSLEKALGNSKPKFKLTILQIDYLNNIFIPFLENLNFKSKKKIRFSFFFLLFSFKASLPKQTNTLNNFSKRMMGLLTSIGVINNFSKRMMG